MLLLSFRHINASVLPVLLLFTAAVFAVVFPSLLVFSLSQPLSHVLPLLFVLCGRALSVGFRSFA